MKKGAPVMKGRGAWEGSKAASEKIEGIEESHCRVSEIFWRRSK